MTADRDPLHEELTEAVDQAPVRFDVGDRTDLITAVWPLLARERDRAEAVQRQVDNAHDMITGLTGRRGDSDDLVERIDDLDTLLRTQRKAPTLTERAEKTEADLRFERDLVGIRALLAGREVAEPLEGGTVAWVAMLADQRDWWEDEAARRGWAATLADQRDQYQAQARAQVGARKRAEARARNALDELADAQTTIRTLRRIDDEAERVKAVQRECNEAHDELARALGYGGIDATGDHTIVTIAREAASKLCESKREAPTRAEMLVVLDHKDDADLVCRAVHDGPCDCGASDAIDTAIGRGWLIVAEPLTEPGGRRFAVGDPDPTPEDVPPCCWRCEPDGSCTWEHGHAGQHVAGDGRRVVGVAEPADPVPPAGQPPELTDRQWELLHCATEARIGLHSAERRSLLHLGLVDGGGIITDAGRRALAARNERSE